MAKPPSSTVTDVSVNEMREVENPAISVERPTATMGPPRFKSRKVKPFGETGLKPELFVPI